MIQYLYLGRVDYADALRLQSELVALRTEGRIANTLLLLEHPPVLTLGRNARRANVLASDELLAQRGVTLHEINRGGDVTYHGPGQLIGYPIFDLRSLRNARANPGPLHPEADAFESTRPSGSRRPGSEAATPPLPGIRSKGARLGPVDFVRLIEESLIRLCGEFAVPTGRICQLTGVWSGLPSEYTGTACAAPQSVSQGRKIAAIGIHVARGVTSHGFAFNVTTDLRDFQLINPCGITDRPVTSLAREVPDPTTIPPLESIAHRAARQFGLVFNQQILAVENLGALRAHGSSAEAAQESAAENPPPEFPANDTPLQVPPEIERLRNPRPRPISA